MLQSTLILLTVFFAASVLFSPLSAQEPSLSEAAAPYAPLEVTKHASDPLVPLSRSQRDELLGEFKGLVHMGLRKVPLDQWEGKDMADCDKPQRPQDHWNYRCEIITGQGNGYYYFSPTLQEVDVRVHASDEQLLDDFRRPVQDMFGRASFVSKAVVPARPTSPIRHWDGIGEAAELFMDQGSVRFVWLRHPL